MTIYKYKTHFIKNKKRLSHVIAPRDRESVENKKHLYNFWLFFFQSKNENNLRLPFVRKQQRKIKRQQCLFEFMVLALLSMIFCVLFLFIRYANIVEPTDCTSS